jgi:hypothetical protein
MTTISELTSARLLCKSHFNQEDQGVYRGSFVSWTPSVRVWLDAAGSCGELMPERFRSGLCKMNFEKNKRSEHGIE